jgi:asparagine synthase (glutamine-hydrolysing)
MCGIAGLWQLAGSRDLAAQSRAMTKAIASRGPDGEGHWTDPAAGIAASPSSTCHRPASSL